jgi:hypothetical protein
MVAGQLEGCCHDPFALGGTSYAAVTVTGRQVKDGSLTGRDVRNGSLTGRDVRNGSLTGSDLKPKSVPLNRLSGAPPVGAAGPAGHTGPTGPTGPPGEPDYSRVYDKAAADARFLAKAGKAADADTLDGLDGSAYAQGSVVTRSASKTVATSSTVELLKVPGWGSVAVLNCSASFANVGLTKDGSDASVLWMETSTNPAGISSLGGSWGGAGSYSAPSGWVRYTVAKPGAMVVFEAHGGWTGSGCAFAVTASEHVG